MEKVLEFAEALKVVLAEARNVGAPRGVEALGLSEAAGRVLAEAVVAPRDQPGFDRSTRDGYAVRAADVDAGSILRLVGSVRAGERWQGCALEAGEAIEIMTGAPMPAGADAVLMVEHANLLKAHLSPFVEGEPLHLTPERIRVAEGRTLAIGENVVACGAEARRGDVVLPAGTLLDAAAVALAASCGQAKLRVWRRPVVAIVSTGDELVELGEGEPEPWEIFNSNSYALETLVREAGGEARRLGIARDTREAIEARLREAEEADLVLLSGGVSMGKFDFVEEALAACGADFLFTGARIQPGKPVVFGRMRERVSESASQRASGYFFGLPGNPVSTEVCFRLFAAPLLRAMAGEPVAGPRFVEAKVAEAFEGKRGLVRFLPCAVEGDWKGVQVRPVRWQGSGDLAANARGRGFCVVEDRGLAVGDTARVLVR